MWSLSHTYFSIHTSELYLLYRVGRWHVMCVCARTRVRAWLNIQNLRKIPSYKLNWRMWRCRPFKLSLCAFCLFVCLPDTGANVTCKILVLWKQNHIDRTALDKVHFMGLRSTCTGLENLNEILVNLLGSVLHHIFLKKNLVAMVS